MDSFKSSILGEKVDFHGFLVSKLIVDYLSVILVFSVPFFLLLLFILYKFVKDKFPFFYFTAIEIIKFSVTLPISILTVIAVIQEFFKALFDIKGTFLGILSPSFNTNGELFQLYTILVSDNMMYFEFLWLYIIIPDISVGYIISAFKPSESVFKDILLVLKKETTFEEISKRKSILHNSVIMKLVKNIFYRDKYFIDTPEMLKKVPPNYLMRKFKALVAIQIKLLILITFCKIVVYKAAVAILEYGFGKDMMQVVIDDLSVQIILAIIFLGPFFSIFLLVKFHIIKSSVLVKWFFLGGLKENIEELLLEEGIIITSSHNGKSCFKQVTLQKNDFGEKRVPVFQSFKN